MLDSQWIFRERFHDFKYRGGGTAERCCARHQRLAGPSLATLEPDFEVRGCALPWPSESQLAKEVADADALITLVTDPVTEEFSARAKLDRLGQYWRRRGQHRSRGCGRLGIVVTNTPTC
jgi:phosphoglycerate dehydrogenase-like enzyme